MEKTILVFLIFTFVFLPANLNGGGSFDQEKAAIFEASKETSIENMWFLYDLSIDGKFPNKLREISAFFLVENYSSPEVIFQWKGDSVVDGSDMLRFVESLTREDLAEWLNPKNQTIFVFGGDYEGVEVRLTKADLAHSKGGSVFDLAVRDIVKLFEEESGLKFSKGETLNFGIRYLPSVEHWVAVLRTVDEDGQRRIFVMVDDETILRNGSDSEQEGIRGEAADGTDH